AMARPIVSFELFEARVSAGESAIYVNGTDVVAFASAIDELLDDPERRDRMGHVGRERVERELSWDISQRNLIDFDAGVLGSRGRRRGQVTATGGQVFSSGS